MSEQNKVTSGIHPHFMGDEYYSFVRDEMEIIDIFSKEWFVTTGKSSIKISSASSYGYVLLKPVANYQEMFNLDREIIVIFSPYDSFEPRTIDAIDYVSSKLQSLRIDKIVSVIVSKDNAIESKIKDILKSNQESQIIVPFSYEELKSNKSDPYFIRNRFKSYFYTRDLFAFEAPLKKDLYFFGRNDLIHKITSRHKSNENSGLFGLRKTGKTSVIYGIERTLSKEGAETVIIDCQNTAFHKRRWNKALFFVLSEIQKKYQINSTSINESDFTEENASLIFESELLKIYLENGQKSILIIFDEIENITFGVSPTEHWTKELDFVYFWQTLRSLFQKHTNLFSYLIVGTNPTCVEMPTINGKDNPIFNQFSPQYIQGFEVSQTREMVRKLGRTMGLKFDELIYSKLTEDFGGHPFLIRQVCSLINEISPNQRPVTIDRIIYQEAKNKFKDKSHSYIEMIISILKTFYDEEYDMMTFLALEDFETFSEFAFMSPHYTNHLLGYGIIEKNDNRYAFKIDSVKEHLQQIEKRKRKINSIEGAWVEVSIRRNKLETVLRKIVRNQLKIRYGKSEAKNIVLRILGKDTKLGGNSYDDLFDLQKSEMYFLDLRKIINKEWEIFKNIFGNQEDFLHKMDFINKYRIDAHAKSIKSEELDLLRLYLSQIEDSIEDFE